MATKIAVVAADGLAVLTVLTGEVATASGTRRLAEGIGLADAAVVVAGDDLPCLVGAAHTICEAQAQQDYGQGEFGGLKPTKEM